MERKPYLLRLDPVIFDALQHWAEDELRSLNAQLEFLLRQNLKDVGRLPRDDPGQPSRRARRGRG